MRERFYGPYRGTVEDNADPLNQMRIRVRVPAVLGDIVSAWVLPCVPPGFSSVPDIGSTVWIEFEGGDMENPVWIGTLGGDA